MRNSRYTAKGYTERPGLGLAFLAWRACFDDTRLGLAPSALEGTTDLPCRQEHFRLDPQQTPAGIC